MTVVIKKGESKVSIERKMTKLIQSKKVKGFPADKFLGKLKTKKDPLEIQKELRNEWRERSR